MIQNNPIGRLVAHIILIVGILIVAFPIYYAFIASTQSLQDIMRPPLSLLPGGHFWENYTTALFGGIGRIGGVSVGRLLINSTIMALAIAVGKIIISILSAYAIVFFRFPGRMVFFWLIFITLMLPVEVRILPTYKVMVDLGLIDTYTGLTVPLMASATATLLFRQAAAGAAACHHDCLFLLARVPGHPPVGAARGSVRPVDPVRRPRQFQAHPE